MSPEQVSCRSNILSRKGADYVRQFIKYKLSEVYIWGREPYLLSGGPRHHCNGRTKHDNSDK